MRIIILLFNLFFVLNISKAQKIEKIEIDKFTGYKRIETSYANIVSKFFEAARFQFKTVDSDIYIMLDGNWAVGVVGPSDPAMFLFDDKSTITIYPTTIQSYDIGSGGRGYYRHQYSITKSDLILLSQKNVVSFRREYDKYYADTEVNERNAKKIKALASVLLEKL